MSTHRIVLDYGHGGSKAGAVYNGVEEKTINLLTGELIYRKLHQLLNSIQVLLTRDDDYDIPLPVRWQLINEHHKRKQLDLVVSIHHNACGTPSRRGFEVYYNKDDKSALKACEIMVQQMKNSGIKVNGNGIVTTKQLGVELSMIHEPEPVSILIEIGYLSNNIDRANFLDPYFRNQVAGAAAQGIVDYIKEVG